MRARGNLINLFRAIEVISDQLDVNSHLRLDLPDAESTSSLAIDQTTTAAMLASLAEINASPHSYSSFGPDWSNGSNALITIGGEYNGNDGSGNLSFEVRQPGTHGADNLRIRVRDPAGSVVSNLNIRANDQPNEQYDLQNGLFLTLGPGNLIDNDTASIQLFQNIGSAVDASLPLGGLRNQNPGFQYYPSPNTLPRIINGSFLLNGATITVNAAESMNDVITRINQSTAGVTAAFNAVSERLEMTQNTSGSAATIDLQGDTSNFLRSAKLDMAVVVDGIDPESQQFLSAVNAFSSVQSGNIIINGVSIDVDADADSLESLLAKFNSSAANVSATFDPQSRRVRIEANDASGILELDSNGTNVFSALTIPEGRVDPKVDGDGVSRRRSYAIADAFENLAAELNLLFNNNSFESGAKYVAAPRSRIESVLSALFTATSETLSNSFGLKFDRSTEARSNGSYASVDRRNLTQNLQRRGEDVKKLFIGSGENDGLITKLTNTVLTALRDVNGQLGFSGSVIDTYA